MKKIKCIVVFFLIVIGFILSLITPILLWIFNFIAFIVLMIKTKKHKKINISEKNGKKEKRSTKK